MTRLISRNLAVILLISISVGAFATLGDGKIRKERPGTGRSLLSNKTQANSFSLRSGYTFRGMEVINTHSQRFININTTVTYTRGNTSYIAPLKKKLILENVKIDLSNRQFQRN